MLSGFRLQGYRLILAAAFIALTCHVCCGLRLGGLNLDPTNTSISVTWVVSGDTGEESYTVTYQGNNCDTLQSGTHSDVRQTSFMIERLHPGYQYSVSVSYDDEQENSRLTGQVSTLESAPSASAGSFSVASVTSRSVALTWTTLACDQRNGFIANVTIWNHRPACHGPTKLTEVERNETASYFRDLLPGQDYIFWIVFATAAGAGPFSNAVHVRTYDEAPSTSAGNFRVASATSRNVILTWETVPCNQSNGIIRNYTIRYTATVCGTTNRQAVIVSGNDEAVDISGLSPGQEYAFTISASTTAGEGQQSSAVQRRTDDEAPSASVENLRVTSATSRSAVLAWTAIACEGTNGIITNYIIRYTVAACGIPRLLNRTVGPGETAANIPELQPGQTYSFAVSAVTAAGEGPQSDAVQLRTDEEAPSASAENFIVANATSRSIAFTWTAVPCEKRNGIITRYIIRYVVTSCGTTRTLTETLSGDETAANIWGLSPGQDYTFSISAMTAVGHGPQSGAVQQSTKEEAPARSAENFQVAGVTSTSVALVWTAVACEHGNGLIANYTVRYSVTICGTQKMLSETVDGSETAMNITELSRGENYSFTISAATAAGEGPQSVAVQQRTSDEAPSASAENFTVVNFTSRSVALKWTAVACDQSNGIVQSYTIRYGVTACGITQALSETVGASKTAMTISGLLPGQNYTFTISASTAGGEGPQCDPVLQRTNDEAPSASAENLKVAEATSRTVAVTWVAVACDQSNGIIKSYTIWYSVTTCGTTRALNETVSGNETAISISGLLPGHDYTFTISATTAVGEGPPSNPLQQRTNEEAPEASAEAFEIASVTSRSVALKWMPVECNLRNGVITNYTVHYDADVCDISTRLSVTVEASEMELNISGLSPGQDYNFTISASNSAGESTQSDVILVSTNDEAPSGTAQDFTVTSQDSTSVYITWDHVPCEHENGIITAYVIRYATNICGTTKHFVTTVTGSETEASIRGLTPGQDYSFSIAATTAVGEGPAANVTASRTGEEAPTGAVESFAITNVTSRSIRLTGFDVMCAKRNGIIQKYIVRFSANVCGKTSESNVTISGDDKELTISDLLPGQDYRFIVAAATSAGEGPPTEPVLGRTYEEAPSGQPQNLQCLAESESSISLRWDPVKCPERNGVIENYELQWKKIDGDTGEGRNIPALNVTMSAIVKDLSPSSDYNITVAGITSAGYSKAALCSVRTSAASADPGVIAASTVASGAAAATAGSVAAWFYKRRQRLMNMRGVAGRALPVSILAAVISRISRLMRTRTTADKDADDETSPDSVLDVVVSRKRPTTFSDMEQYVRKMHMNSNFLFDTEYKNLGDLSPKHPTTAAKLEGNLAKNRFADNLPFDLSRVKLLQTDDDECSDYINASYVPGNDSQRDYIAAQGPLPATIEDFWRMIWEQDVSMVVMLTQLVEKGKRKCEQYWPETLREPHNYGEISVVKNEELIKPDYTVRYIEMHSENKIKKLIQCHYTSWPESGCPRSTEVMLDFVETVQTTRLKEAVGPTVVHCSAGVGRTGAYICIERLVKQLASESGPQEIDIFGMVLDMRDFRSRIVQTENQYAFIHDCIQKYIQDMLSHGSNSLVSDSEDHVSIAENARGIAELGRHVTILERSRDSPADAGSSEASPDASSTESA